MTFVNFSKYNNFCDSYPKYYNLKKKIKITNVFEMNLSTKFLCFEGLA